MTRAITKYCELCIIFMTLWENSNFDWSLDMHCWSIININDRKILLDQNCDIVPLDKVSYIEIFTGDTRHWILGYLYGPEVVSSVTTWVGHKLKNFDFRNINVQNHERLI